MKSKFTTLGIIPVRLESTRLPNKPLKDIAGKTLIERVWNQAKKCKNLQQLVVATDSIEIQRECFRFGAEVVMTGKENETGTDRVAEACAILEASNQNFDIVANIQGDMPFINPDVIDSTIQNLINANSSMGMSTIATPVTDKDEFERPSSVKVVLGQDGQALYFSRAPIPYWRDFPGEDAITADNPFGYKHMGLYVFKRETLSKITKLQRATTEQREGLEQLRALANGIGISVNIVDRKSVAPAIEVDTPYDLDQAIQYAQGINQ